MPPLEPMTSTEARATSAGTSREGRRTPLVAGNWKMHKRLAEARLLARQAADMAEELPGVEIMVAPPATALAAVAEVLEGSRVSVAAQNGHWAERGAFTGEIAMAMLAELAGAVIVGHSERRQHFGETDADVNRKVHAAFAAGLVPVLCLGEDEADRDAGRADEVVLAQLEAGAAGIATDEANRLVVAYEPVWAIGTGRACDPEEAARVCGLLRSALGRAFGAQAGAAGRMLYGGSVKPDNAAAYFQADDVDGALVGGASLDIESFRPIAAAAFRAG